MKNKKFLLLIALVVLVCFTLSGCVPGDGAATILKPAGFFSGIWHGIIAPVSLIMSIFNSKYAIYETFNQGFWYDFGFYIAIIGSSGGTAFGGIRIVKGRDR